MNGRIVLSVNTSWNVINFRLGLIRALQKAGYHVVAATPADRDGEKFAGLGFAHEAVAIDRNGVSPFRDALLFLSYFRLLRRLRPDFYLAFTVKPNVYGSLAAHLLRIKVINNIAGLGAAFVRETWLTKIVSWLYRISLRGSYKVFFQNEEDRTLFVSRGLVDPGKTGLLPGSGVNLLRFSPGPPAATERFTFLLTARLLWDKGIREYVEAARAIRRDRADVRFQLLGFLDLPNRDAVPRHTVEEWVREGIIEYLGEAEDVRPHLEAANCVVLPSRYREGVPRSLLEAAAMARPVIATDAPGCRDAVRHGENGLLCKAKDVDSLVAAMREMLDYPEERRRAMGAAGRALVEARFSEEIVARHYLDAMQGAG